jgi:uncharacterized damage-inducible protein DinB
MSALLETLRGQVDYTAWASRRLLAAASELTPEEMARDFQTSDRSVLGTLAHIFAADRIWLARFRGESLPTFLTDADRDFGTLQNNWPPLLTRWEEWAAQLTEERALAPFPYVDLKGRDWNQPLCHLVLHVVNHGTHHRGQVSGFLRALGHTPPPTDLHYYYRQA